MGDWIEWEGGECPVSGNTLVEVRYRGFPDEFNDSDRAEVFTFGPNDNWKHEAFPKDDNHDGDIIAYRLSTPTAQVAGEGV